MNSEPVIGASVLIKGSTISHEVSVKGKNSFSICLQDDLQMLEEV